MKLGSWVVSALALRALTACYAPTTASGAPCDTTTNMCPSGQTCVAVSGTQGTCILSGHGSDGGSESMEFCLGSKLAGSVCVEAAPTNAVTLNAAISTESVATGNCTEIHVQGAVKYCLITGDTITVPTGTTVHAIGANPLVLMAAHTITVSGTIDVSSHVNESFGGAIVAGAGGRRTATDCVAVGIDGTQGSGTNGSGGGGGGSFSTLGAAGGNGRNNTASGKPVAATAPATLVGGCPGGAGGAGSGGGGAGPAGFGGGVAYLLAGTSVTVSGTINASGGGGGAGGPGDASSGGGGGGGAGGLIGVESPATTISGIVFANGGGGGGGGDASGVGGNAGVTATLIGTAAAGGKGANDGGGDGGAGSTATAPNVGSPAKSSNNGPYAAGGGGGGGLGFIKVYGTPTTTGAMFSPPMTSN